MKNNGIVGPLYDNNMVSHGISTLNVGGVRLIKSSLIITPILILSKFFILLVYAFLAYQYGVSIRTDAVFFALGFITLINGIMGSAVESAIVPIYLSARNSDEQKRSVSQLIRTLTFILSIGLFIIIIFTVPILRLFTKFDTKEINEILLYLIIILPAEAFYLWNSLFRGIINANGHFIFVSLNNLFESFTTFLGIIVMTKFIGLKAVPVSYCISSLLSFIIIRYYSAKYKILNISFRKIFGEYLFKINKYDKALYYMIIQIICTAFVSSNIIINQFIASQLGGGAVSYLSYASRMFYVPVTLITAGFFSVFLSLISNSYYSKAGEIFKKHVNRSLFYGSTLSLGVMLIFLIFGEYLMKIFFMRGKFTNEDVRLTIAVFNLFLIGIVPYVITLMLGRVHIALLNYKIIIVLSILNPILTIVFNILFVKMLGLKGIGLGTSIVYVILGISFYIALVKSSSWKLCK